MGFSGCHIPGHTGTDFKNRRVFDRPKLSPTNIFKVSGISSKYDLEEGKRYKQFQLVIKVVILLTLLACALFIVRIITGVDLLS